MTYINFSNKHTHTSMDSHSPIVHTFFRMFFSIHQNILGYSQFYFQFIKILLAKSSAFLLSNHYLLRAVVRYLYTTRQEMPLLFSALMGAHTGTKEKYLQPPSGIPHLCYSVSPQLATCRICGVPLPWG